jgi:hypothetical protein
MHWYQAAILRADSRAARRAGPNRPVVTVAEADAAGALRSQPMRRPEATQLEPFIADVASARRALLNRQDWMAPACDAVDSLLIKLGSNGQHSCRCVPRPVAGGPQTSMPLACSRRSPGVRRGRENCRP